MADEITPKHITELTQVPVQEVNALSEGVMQAAINVSAGKEALEDLSASLSKFAEKKKEYDDVANTVRKKMRNVVTMI